MLTSIADWDGVGLAAVERDYVMSHVISSLAEQPIADALEFKGETSLRLCHFLDYRYSADIDMNLTHGLTRVVALQGIENAVANAQERLSMPLLTMSPDEQSIAFIGPRIQ